MEAKCKECNHSKVCQHLQNYLMTLKKLEEVEMPDEFKLTTLDCKFFDRKSESGIKPFVPTRDWQTQPKDYPYTITYSK